MIQRKLLLQALRDAGREGVHTFELRAEYRIGNPSERRRDLEAEGHVIGVTREKRGGRWGARFRLVSEARVQDTGGGGNPSLGVAQSGLNVPRSVPAAASGVGTDRGDQGQESGSLFEVEPPKPRNPFVHGDLDEAA